MKKILGIFLIALFAAVLAGCPSGAGTNTNANANSSTEAPAKDLKATLLEVDKNFTVASKNKDTKFFEENVTDNFAGVTPGGFFDKPSGIKSMSEDKCEDGPSSNTDINVKELGEGIALFTGKGTSERTCEGKTTKYEGNFAVLYVKDGDTWKAAYYQSAQAPVKEEAKSDEGAKKEEKPAAKAEDKTKEAPMTPKFADDDELARTLTGKEGDLWAAWAKKDTKPFEEAFAADFQEMTPEGLKARADVLKQIAENKCEITGTSVGSTHAIKINDDLVLFIYKGSANGTCEGKPAGAAYDASIWKKDGDNWKVVFHMESPEMK